VIEWFAQAIARLRGAADPPESFADCLDQVIREGDRLTLRLSTVERAVGLCTDSVPASISQEN